MLRNEASSFETTLEVNPSTVERERLPAFREVGVDRISLGAQSFCDRTLKRLGRAHRGEEAERTFRACRAAGFERISLDLIFAAPDQRLADFEAAPGTDEIQIPCLNEVSWRRRRTPKHQGQQK